MNAAGTATLPLVNFYVKACRVQPGQLDKVIRFIKEKEGSSSDSEADRRTPYDMEELERLPTGADIARVQLSSEVTQTAAASEMAATEDQVCVPQVPQLQPDESAN
ncbi:unnamed protein product [Symbiodinium pilosum]|uniref:Uncharacterized protein n=1 Tax=Symbiodinium pilosum TaxID=2952 RepID=A0A812W8Z4_SYMPI|nr:unnamed protein product [Symbiodinium pilosum]